MSETTAFLIGIFVALVVVNLILVCLLAFKKKKAGRV